MTKSEFIKQAIEGDLIPWLSSRSREPEMFYLAVSEWAEDRFNRVLEEKKKAKSNAR